MAIVNILGKSERSINWKAFLRDYNTLNIDTQHIEIFPIPKELGFDEDSVAINVHANYTDVKTILFQLKQIVFFFQIEPYSLKFIELYDGVEINPVNAHALLERLIT